MRIISPFPGLVSRFLGAAFFFFVLTAFAAGEEPGQQTYGLKLSSSTGFLYGQGEEIVYKYPGKEAFLSQLLWDMKPLFYIGAGLEFTRIRPLEGPGFWSALNLRYGIPAGTGAMEDRDWRNSREDFLTHYSRHDVRTNTLFAADLRMGPSIPLFSRSVLKVFLGVSYMYVQWTAMDGYYQYAAESNGDFLPWDASIQKSSFSGTAIIYAQNWFSVFPGISLGAPLGKRFSWEFNTSISPFVYGIMEDQHPVRNLRFTDRLYENVLGGFLWEGRGELFFSVLPRLDLGLYLSWHLVKGQRGTSYAMDTKYPQSGKGKINGEAGAGYSFINPGVSVKLHF